MKMRRKERGRSGLRRGTPAFKVDERKPDYKTGGVGCFHLCVRLHLDRAAEYKRDKVTLLQSSLTYRDKRLEGFDAACVVEVMEHMDINRLPAFERVVFEFAAPRTVIVTTPNAEYNKNYERLSAESMRHPDHRFEWTRDEFRTWAESVCQPLCARRR